MRGATITKIFRGVCHRVSIHAPHAGRDQCLWASARYHPCFNPRAPCGARPDTDAVRTPYASFQSTRPMRGATRAGGQDSAGRWFQSTRPMRGATHCIYFVCNNAMFQSTRPMRGATRCGRRARSHSRVSIHAPRAGRDLILHADPRCIGVSIHAPRVSIHAPRAGRDARAVLARRHLQVSIHAPRAGRDAA